ncbi:MAG: hypothetical protein J0I32_09975 [Sphingobacteriales bacterium]|nr:hypothetical protein [Sphingobacteriales bacterium]OJW00320.1 MAG: hypothetical protein BGO52_04355 [Sphingobacteriales bacterium 44-61]
MKSLIVYQGRYGATQQYAEWLHQKFALNLLTATACGEEQLKDTELVVMGSSVYIGKLEISNWVKQHSATLRGKKLVLFVVSGTPKDQTEKLRQYVRSSLPDFIAEKCDVYYLDGRLVYNKLLRKDRFMLRMGALFAGKVNGHKMLAGYDGVKEENLADLYQHLEEMLYQHAL